MKIITALCLTIGVLLTMTACGTIGSGTDKTKIISSGPTFVKILVYSDSYYGGNYYNSIYKNIAIADRLATDHCKKYGRIKGIKDVDNSFFKTFTYPCHLPEQLQIPMPNKGTSLF